MRRSWVVLGIAAILVAGCGSGTNGAGTSTASPSAVGAAIRTDLAPTGKLRIGFPAMPPFLGQQDPASGQWKGLAIAMGSALAARLGVPMVPTLYADPGTTYQALQSGGVDVVLAQLQAKPDATTGTGAVVRLEHTFLVRSGSPLSTASDVDRDGIKVGAVQGSPHTAFLASHLLHAQLVQFASADEGLAALAAGRIDAYADVRFVLAGLATQVPGSSILGGSFFTPGLGLVILSNRGQGAAFLASFVASQLAAGDVQRDIDAIGKPGVLAGPGA